MSNKNQPQYKRGTIIKNGKRYGFYPDGSLYRIYSTTDRPFLEIVDIEGETFLRIRQATELGYTDCPVFGAADLNYPTSALRRSRTIWGGQIGECTHGCQQQSVCVCRIINRKRNDL